MATTLLMTRHTGSGMTIMETLKDGFDYGKNPDKTRNGDLILAYDCNRLRLTQNFYSQKQSIRQSQGGSKNEKMMYYIIKSGSRSRPVK